MDNELTRREMLGLGLAGLVVAAGGVFSGGPAQALTTGEARALIDQVVGEVNARDQLGRVRSGGCFSSSRRSSRAIPTCR